MNELFAVDPNSSKDYKEFKILFEMFGFDKGRFICQYPDNWADRIRNVLDSLNGQDRARAETYLLSKSKELYPLDGSYSDQLTWIENARELNRKENYLFTVVSNQQLDKVVDIDSVIYGNYLEKYKSNALIDQDLDAYIKAICPLFRFSEEVFIADSYFQLREFPGENLVKSHKDKLAPPFGRNFARELQIESIDKAYTHNAKHIEFLTEFCKEASKSKRTKRIIVLFKNMELKTNITGNDYELLIGKDIDSIKETCLDSRIDLDYRIIPAKEYIDTHWRLIFSINCGIVLDAGIRFSHRTKKKNELHWVSRNDLEEMIAPYEKYFPTNTPNYSRV